MQWVHARVSFGSRPAKWLLVAVTAAAALLLVPRYVCGRDADGYFDARRATQQAIADGVARRIVEHEPLHFFETGLSRFDGQSAIAIYQMTLLGLGQVVLEHPELREAYLPAMRIAADRLVDPHTLAYAEEVYGWHGAVQMAADQGHAYLGYINLGLGMLRLIEPDTRHAALHDRITAALAQRLDRAANGLIETYPDETWPPDVAAVAGSIGLHARATGNDRSALLARWAARFAECAIHSTGYLVQRVDGCEPADAPRGSGTAVAAYFISFAHPALSERLHRAVREVGSARLMSFAAVREYAPGFDGQGDTNAGPIVLGFSVGATGFALGSAKAHGDRELFTELYRTTHLFGVPVDVGHERRHVMGGILGDALLLAMLTARAP